MTLFSCGQPAWKPACKDYALRCRKAAIAIAAAFALAGCGDAQTSQPDPTLAQRLEAVKPAPPPPDHSAEVIGAIRSLKDSIDNQSKRSEEAAKDAGDRFGSVVEKLVTQTQMVRADLHELQKPAAPPPPPAAVQPTAPPPQASPPPVRATPSGPYGNYTGIICWGDVVNCEPCLWSREDIGEAAIKAGYDAGYNRTCDFWFRNETREMVAAGMPMPRFEVVENGVIKQVKIGYQRGGADLDWIFDHHPRADKTQPTYQVSPYGANNYARGTSAPSWVANQGVGDFRDVGRVESAVSGAPMPYMGRFMAFDADGYLGRDGCWHKHWCPRGAPVATFATAEAASAAKYRALDAAAAYVDRQYAPSGWQTYYAYPVSSSTSYASYSSGSCPGGVCYPH